MSSSAIRELLKLTQLPNIISFAGGLPSPDVFPIEEFNRASEVVLLEQGRQALQYSTTEGYRPLREMIAQRLNRYRINVSPENIIITSGSQQALDLLGKIFINRGDRILVEAPTFLGALQAWNSYGAEFISVPTDEHGMVIDALEDALRTGPKFIYVLPNFQNPTGVTLTLERRKKLIEIADNYGVPIIEDDPYGQLRYEGEHIAPVVVLDDQYRNQSDLCYHGNVIYTSTFSKILAPGIRLAWVTAPEEVIRKLVLAKQGVDLHTATLTQMIAYEIGRSGFLDNHIKTIRDVYRERRDLMLASAEEHFPSEVKWTRPQGGLFLWVTMPEHIDAKEIFHKAVENKVAFVAGSPFFPDGSGHNTFRLNFSNASKEGIIEGMRRLGVVLKEAI
jgi:2-aminoadipate transaminase